MRVLVCSRSDPASLGMRDRLLELGEWEATTRTFRGRPVWARTEAILVEVAGPSVHDEALDGDLRQLGLPIRDVWFLSKHAAASGTPSFTVHPIGNPGEARFGGRPGALVPSAARDMGALLRRLRARATQAELPHQVTYEATHHGPWLGFPTLFVEIGSDDRWYRDPTSHDAAAKAVSDVLGGEGRCDGPVVVGVGGGHYVPRATDLGLAGEADFGHLLPTHAVEAISDEALAALLRQAVAATPGCEGVHIHRKALKGELRRRIEAACAQAGAPAWSRAAAGDGS